jgi:uncharacterized paraquat-inducible protein A
MVKLKKGNMRKYCLNCHEYVTINFDGFNGCCPVCKEILYVSNNKKKLTEDGK